MKVFASYHFPDEQFVRLVTHQLNRQRDLETYFYPHERRTGGFRREITEALTGSDKFVAFLGLERGETQEQEIGWILDNGRADDLLLVRLPEEDALRDVVLKLVGDEIDILYVIGGDGSMRAAHAIWAKAGEMRDANRVGRELSVVAIPKTMDNDILWVWQAFGFLSAVEKAKEFVLQLHTEAKSNPRLCIMQLFGSDSGFVTSRGIFCGRSTRAFRM